jgi:hypothetical protein
MKRRFNAVPDGGGGRLAYEDVAFPRGRNEGTPRNFGRDLPGERVMAGFERSDVKFAAVSRPSSE